MKKTVAMASAVAAVVVPSALSPLGASASPARPAADVSQTPLARANPGVDLEVIASLPQAVKNSDVRIDPSVGKNTVVFNPDGSPVAGQSPEKMTQARAIAASGGCNGWTTFYGPPGKTGAEATQDCAVFGHVGYRHGIQWQANPGVSTTASVEARGFKCKEVISKPQPGSDCGPSGYEASWQGVGSGNSGKGSVFWGNNLANPKVRAKSLSVPMGYTGVFR